MSIKNSELFLIQQHKYYIMVESNYVNLLEYLYFHFMLFMLLYDNN